MRAHNIRQYSKATNRTVDAAIQTRLVKRTWGVASATGSILKSKIVPPGIVCEKEPLVDKRVEHALVGDNARADTDGVAWTPMHRPVLHLKLLLLKRKTRTGRE